MLLFLGWNAFAQPLGPVTAVRAVPPSTSPQDTKAAKQHARPGTFKASAPTSVRVHGCEALVDASTRHESTCSIYSAASTPFPFPHTLEK